MWRGDSLEAVNGSFESPRNRTRVWPYEWELRRSPTVRRWRQIGLSQQRSSHAMLSSAIEANLEIEKRSGVSPPLASWERAAPCLDRTQRVPCADACFGWQRHKRNRTSAAAVQACVSSNFKHRSDAEGKVERLCISMFRFFPFFCGCLFLVNIVNVLLIKALHSILFYSIP